MIHKTTITLPAESSVEDVAKLVANLRYDALVKFFDALSQKLMDDAIADRRRGRAKLASALLTLSGTIDMSRYSAEKVWEICAPYGDCASS